MYDVAHSALYEFIEMFIESINDAAHPLYGAETLRSLKKSLEETPKVVRVGCNSGMFNISSEDACKQKDVDFVIECFVTPSDAENEAVKDEALDESFGMAQAIFTRLMESEGQTLSAKVSMVDGNEYDKDFATLGGVERGATYFYGKINKDV
jgi:hypothetical protein